MSENSVGNAPVSNVPCQCEADLAHRAAAEGPLDSNLGSNSHLQTALCPCDGESKLKMEIPAEKWKSRLIAIVTGRTAGSRAPELSTELMEHRHCRSQ